MLPGSFSNIPLKSRREKKTFGVVILCCYHDGATPFTFRRKKDPFGRQMNLHRSYLQVTAPWIFYINGAMHLITYLFFPLAVYYVLNEEDLPVTTDGWMNGFEYHFHTA